MGKPCPKCDTLMLPCDDMDCAKANWVCPECAPKWVTANATTFTDIKDPLKADGK